MSSDGLDSPPSADPGPDIERALREIRDARPEIGCLGHTITGGWALVTLGGLLLSIAYLVRRRR